MNLLNKDFALNILIKGKNEGCSLGYLINKKTTEKTLVHIYYRNYKDKHYEIAEVKRKKEIPPAFYKISKEDYIIEDEQELKKEWELIFTGIENTLNDVIDLLKNEKKEVRTIRKISNKQVEEIKSKYKKGTKIQLIKMNNDPQPVPDGTIGIVDFVDDIGTVHMIWENGSSLGLIIGEDKFEIIERK